MVEPEYIVETANVNTSSLNSKIQLNKPTNHKQQAIKHLSFIVSVNKTVHVIKHISTESEYDINML